MTDEQVVHNLNRLMLDRACLLGELEMAQSKGDGLKVRFLEYRLRNNERDMEEICPSVNVDTTQTIT